MQVLPVSNKFNTHPEAVFKVPLSLWWLPFSVNVYGSFIENGMCVAEPFKIISVLSLILSLVIPTSNACFVLFKISIVYGVDVTNCIKGMKSNSMFSFQKLLLWYAFAYILVKTLMASPFCYLYFQVQACFPHVNDVKYSNDAWSPEQLTIIVKNSPWRALLLRNAIMSFPYWREGLKFPTLLV